MDNKIWIWASKLLKEQRQRKKWHKVVQLLAAVVVFCTTYALILPAITLEHEVICGKEEHTHTEACYTEQSVLVCGQEETEAHVHTEECYTVSETGEKTLTCTQEETEGHTHTEACYESEYILSCGKEEHTHTEECYAEEEKEKESASDAAADVESESDWLKSIEGVVLTGDWSQDVLAIAESQLGYTESSRNFIVDGDGTRKGYTRYGAWYGDSYGHWCAMFVSFCLNYAQVEGIPLEANCSQWIAKLSEEEYQLYHVAGTYEPKPGDLVFFDIDGDTVSDHVGLVKELMQESEDAPVQLKTIEGNSSDCVQYVTYELTDSRIIGYGQLPEEPQDSAEGQGQSYHYEDDAVAVEVTLPAESTVPEDAVLRVEPIGDTDASYDALARQAEQAVSGTVEKIVLYDISFYTAEEEYIPVAESATVHFRFKETVLTKSSGEVTVLHYESGEDAPVRLDEVEVTKDETDTLSDVTFRTDGFSIYAVVKVTDGTGGSGETAVLDLDGKEFVIANLSTRIGARHYAMTSTVNNDGNRLIARPVSISDFNQGEDDKNKYVEGSGLTLWKFTKAGTDGSYYIQATDTNEYLSLTTYALTTSDTPQAITVTTSASFSGQVKLSANGTTVDWFGNDAANGDIFGPYPGDGQNNYQTLCSFVQGGDENVLSYNLNLGGGHIIDPSGTWVKKTNGVWGETEAPGLAENEQKIPEEGARLFGLTEEPGEEGYYTVYSSGREKIAEQLMADGKSPGKAFRFDGWEASVDGNKYLFAKNAPAAVQEDGIHITDTDGVERVLPTETVLTGKWTEISDLVIFFVNYTGTILDTEGNVSGRNQGHFTGIIGIGHVYFATEQVGADGTFGNDANAAIRIDFVNSVDMDRQEPQIVMDYVTAYNQSVTSNPAASDPQANGSGYNIYQSADGINDTELEVSLLKFIYDNSNVSIKVSTSDNKNNPTIENKNSTADNYSVRWYVLKEQRDAWHIDGVMVAKTAEITVTKTFSGLEGGQVKGILNQYTMPVKLGENAQDYITMETKSLEGQYAYHGQEKEPDGQYGGQSYNWTLNAITDEQYRLSEENYRLDGYDISTITINYYEDEAGQSQIAYGYQDTTEALTTTDGGTQEVVGGVTTAVAFNNFYTPTGTGALSITKRVAGSQENDTGGVLQDAEFTLYDETGTTVVTKEITNIRGSAYFSGLMEGTYILKETKAPDGYFESSVTWTVEVAKNTDGTVVVTVYENDNNDQKQGEGIICYNGGVTQSYAVENTPEAGTVCVTKNFSGLTTLQMENIVKSSSDTGGGYYINLKKKGIKSDIKLYLADAVRSQDGFTFTWMITNLDMTEDDDTPIEYDIKECNYLIDAFADTAITAEINGSEKEVSVSRSEDDSGEKIAEASIEGIIFQKDRSDIVEITNHYINTFTLTLEKVDSVTNAALPGAVFDVYGPYREATDSTRRITYFDPETNQTRTAYFVETITADSTGVAKKEGLRLSEGNNTFVYVINESFAPEGYAPSDEPIVRTVTVDADGYAHGVYTTDVPNTKKADAEATVTVKKEWSGKSNDTQPVEMEIYRKAEGEDTAEKVGQAVTLDGQTDGWSHTWEGLDAYKEVNGEVKLYTYYVRESSQGNYTAEYSSGTVLLTLADGSTVRAAPTGEKGQPKIVTVTNTLYYVLPESGGTGILWLTMGGLLLAAGSLLYGYRLRRKRERRFVD